MIAMLDGGVEWLGWTGRRDSSSDIIMGSAPRQARGGRMKRRGLEPVSKQENESVCANMCWEQPGEVQCAEQMYRVQKSSSSSLLMLKTYRHPLLGELLSAQSFFLSGVNGWKTEKNTNK